MLDIAQLCAKTGSRAALQCIGVCSLLVIIFHSKVVFTAVQCTGVWSLLVIIFHSRVVFTFIVVFIIVFSLLAEALMLFFFSVYLRHCSCYFVFTFFLLGYMFLYHCILKIIAVFGFCFRDGWGGWRGDRGLVWRGRGETLPNPYVTSARSPVCILLCIFEISTTTEASLASFVVMWTFHDLVGGP